MENNKELLLKSLAHIEVILVSTEKVQDYEKFSNNPLVKDITLLHLGQIGELSKRFTNDFKEKYKFIDYRAISGLRNIVIHDYSGIDYNEIFNIIKKDLPYLKKQYNEILTNDYKQNIEKLKQYIEIYVKYRKFNIED